jgi:hypothetical protein
LIRFSKGIAQSITHQTQSRKGAHQNGPQQLQSTLRQRQADIQLSNNMEATQLRTLQSFVESFPPSGLQRKCRYYLLEYTSRLIAEGHETVDLEALNSSGGRASELNGGN